MSSAPKLFDDEPYAIRVLQQVHVAADALYHAAKSDDDRALVENLVGVYGQLGEVVAAQAREMRHYVQAERNALDALEAAQSELGEWRSAAECVADSPDVLAAKLEQLDAENTRLNTRVEELESVQREAARS